jgi:hypothetical protein
VKIGVVSIFEAGPAGSHSWLVSWTAFPRGTLGRWKKLARGPGIVAREKATAKTISSLIDVLLKFFSKEASEGLALKDYPRTESGINLEQDRDIWRILRHSQCA